MAFIANEQLVTRNETTEMFPAAFENLKTGDILTLTSMCDKVMWANGGSALPQLNV